MSEKKGPVALDHRAQGRIFAKANANGDDPKPGLRDVQVAKSAHWSDVKFCLDNSVFVNDWEVDFLLSIAAFDTLSPRQEAKLEKVIAKIEIGRKMLPDRRRR